SNEPNETMPISAFAQKHRSTRYIQNLMTPPRAPYPSVTTPVQMKSYSMPIDLDFQKRYATTVLELEQLNKDLNKVLHEVQQFCCEVSQKMNPSWL
ncbi:hypothetical protein GOODEAATRI_026918, partial [Goodea atripinnis]